MPTIAGSAAVAPCRLAHVPVTLILKSAVQDRVPGAPFDIRTGIPSGPPATVPIAVHTVKIEGNDVYVALSQKD